MLKIYIMGGSGCGKSTLAKKLEAGCPLIYHNVLEYSTRPIREGEVDGVDYKFITDDEYDKIKKDFFQSVEHQFRPGRYGALEKDLEIGKANLIVASIEGFLSGMKRSKRRDENILINIINDDILDIQREGRDPKQEENFNLSVLNQFREDDFIVIDSRYCAFYKEVKLSELKKIRDDEQKLIEFFDGILEEFYEE